MQDLPNIKSNNDIDLYKLFSTFWAYKFLIASTCIFGIVLSVYYVATIKKTYISEAIFKLDQGKSNDTSVGNELGLLANLSKLGGGKINNLQTDLVKGRVFIENLEPKLKLQADPYFNTYNPNPIDPAWKSFIKDIIGWQVTSVDIKEAIWQSIITNYSKNIMLSQTKEGSVKVTVTHAKAERAATIANLIMNEIISISKSTRNSEQAEQLSYLSNTLATSLSDLELTQANLKEFTLKNSALPLESFSERSIQLDLLRSQLNRTSKLHEAIEALLLKLQNKTLDNKDYLTLRKQFPIIDQVEFRRILGQNEIVSSWVWPDINSVNAVSNMLKERKSILNSRIMTSQINAERSSQALQTYAKLEREAKIAEATYTVLIEQVKSHTMATGYRPDRTEVYEFATASTNPSVQNRNILIALGATLGIFFGAVFSLILALYRGVYTSKNLLKSGIQAQFNSSIKTLLPLRKKSLDQLDLMLSKKPQIILRNMAIEIHNSSAKQIVVTSSHAKLTSSDLARTLSSYIQSKTMKVAVIDFSSKTKKLDIDEDRLTVGSFVVAENAKNVSILKPYGDLPAIEFLVEKDFRKKIKSLDSTFELVFLCADDSDAIELLRALVGEKIFHITLARTNKTKSATLMHMGSLHPIQGLLYD